MMAKFSSQAARDAFDVVASAQGASSLAELEKTVGAALRCYGFSVVTAVELERRGGQRHVRAVFGDVGAPAMTHYTERGHGPYCPVVGAASSAPTLWREIRRQALDSRQRLVLDELGEFSLHEGHITVVRRGANVPVAISLAGEYVALDDPIDRMAVHFLSTHYGLIGARLAQTRHTGAGLSPRQVECLAWVREGKSSFDIGEILGISARTVDQHVLTACDRLGVKTRFQAVVEAALCGEFQL